MIIKNDYIKGTVMGRFDNYIDSQSAAKQEKGNLNEIKKTEQELIEEERRKIYLPLIKKILLEFNDVLPKIKRWESKKEAIRKRTFGIKTVKVSTLEVIPTIYCDEEDRTGGSFHWIGKNGHYYKNDLEMNDGSGLYVTEISMEDMVISIFKCLPWNRLKYEYAHGNKPTDEIVIAMHNGNAEEAVYKYFEKVLKYRI